MQINKWRPAVWGLIALVSFGQLIAQVSIRITEQMLNRVEQQYGDAARQRVENWKTLLESPALQQDREKIDEVNRFFNRLRFIDDLRHWQQQDYWATPLEFIATDGGDCEDFSIAKYFTLQALGVDTDKMRLMYVKATRLNQAHMVLAYYPQADAIPLILDNLTDEVLPASQRPDLLPVYSFNGDGLWLAKAQGRGRQIQPSGSHSLWQHLTQRIEQGQ